MRNILVSSDIIPVGQFKSNLAKYLKEIQVHKNSLIITQNGKPAGVLISPEEFDKLRETKLFIDSPDFLKYFLLLTEIQGLSTEDICDVLNISPVNYRVSLHRARQALRKAVEKHFQVEAN